MAMINTSSPVERDATAKNGAGHGGGGTLGESTPRKRVGGGLLDSSMLWRSTPDALKKLDPRTLWRNPVMFVVEIGAVWSTVLAVREPTWFAWMIVFWLWATVILANLAEAVAEGRGKAQADA